MLSSVRAEGYEVCFWVAAVWKWEVQVHSTPKHRQARLLSVPTKDEGREFMSRETGVMGQSQRYWVGQKLHSGFSK